uniref:AlNc14C177G8157 protein n=1 Tax=Albugo laibachii Nc14 TaxID=890382 RepID=F0WP03_9STRA|nr:AlNc14C177G8157 [Albugo laibachii Nc14]|eukprot:CCA23047.1 AlNc14C177G8157 [Albugo laibachii Nc14]
MRLPASLQLISVALTITLSTSRSFQVGEVSPSNIQSLRTSDQGDGPTISMVVISEYFSIPPLKGVDAEQSGSEVSSHDDVSTADYGVLDCDDEEERNEQLTGYELECEELEKESAEDIKDLAPEYLLDCEEGEKADQGEDYTEVMPHDPQPLLICDDEEDSNKESDQISSFSIQHEAASLQENDREESWAEIVRLESMEDLLETTQGATSELEDESSVGRVHEDAFNICESICAYDYSGPACGSDGHTYPNKCMITCLDSGTKYFHRGYCLQHEESSCNVECSRDKELICGIDGQTYINYCHYAVTYCDKRLATLPFLSGECAPDRMTDFLIARSKSDSDHICPFFYAVSLMLGADIFIAFGV